MLCQVPDDTCRWKLNYKSCKTSEVWSAITPALPSQAPRSEEQAHPEVPAAAAGARWQQFWSLITMSLCGKD
jgi:hypothetical protein